MPTSHTDSQHGGPCHLLRLATETLHQICGELSDNDEALGNLRLTCRALEQIPEQHLFRTIYLDRHSSSITFVQGVAQHPRFRLHVKEVRLELERPYAKLSHKQWLYRVESYQHNDRWFSDQDLDEVVIQLAKVGMSKESAWSQYQINLSAQIELESNPAATLADAFDSCFPRLPNISRFICTGNDESKYRRATAYGTWLRRSQRETLTYPDCGGVILQGDKADEQYVRYQAVDNFKDKYALACTTSLLQSGVSLRTIRLAVSWDVLAELDTCWRPPRVLLALEDLQTLAMRTPAGPEADVDRGGRTRLQVITGVEKILMVAPNLKHFELWNGPKANDAYDGFEALGLSLPRVHHSATASQLQSIDLTGITCSVDDFMGVLKPLSGLIRRLSISAAVIKGGYWVDLFEAIRTHLTLSHLELTGHLDETDSADTLLGGWHANLSALAYGGIYLDKVKAYLLKATNDKPWRTMCEGGTRKSWQEAGDQSFRYETGE